LVPFREGLFLGTNLLEALNGSNRYFTKLVLSTGTGGLGTLTPKTILCRLTFSLLSFWFWINENSSQQAAVPVYSVSLLPISQGRRAHRTKTIELINLDVLGTRRLELHRRRWVH
jgi:hypothetical protein